MIIFVSVDNKSISNMSKFTSILTAATVLVMAASCSTQKIAVTAHRGYWKCEEAKHAENSIASLRTAQEQGLWGSEFDVHMTNDCVLLVHHDPDIDGVRIWDANYSDFASSRLKNGERVPTLDEYLTQGEKSDKTVLVMELKKQGDQEAQPLLAGQSDIHFFQPQHLQETGWPLPRLHRAVSGARHESRRALPSRNQWGRLSVQGVRETS